MPSLARREQTCFEQAADFVIEQSFVAEIRDKRADAFSRRLNSLAEAAGAAIPRDEDSCAVLHFYDAFHLQSRIGFDNCARADHKFFRQSSDARKLIPVFQCAVFNGVADLLHKLYVSGLPGGIV